jgi:hypothetical protein
LSGIFCIWVALGTISRTIPTRAASARTGVYTFTSTGGNQAVRTRLLTHRGREPRDPAARGRCLAAGVGPDGDAVINGGANALVESSAGLAVDTVVCGIADEYPPAPHAA